LTALPLQDGGRLPWLVPHGGRPPADGDAKAELAGHLEGVRRQHQSDLGIGAGWVELPGALARKPEPKMSQWRFEINDGVGHKFAGKYIPSLRDWATGVSRSTKETK
jgi:hypothetical protein